MEGRDEARLLIESVAPVIPRRMDAREVIVAMKDSGSRNWRQSEWPGFWFQEAAVAAAKERHGGGPGPRFGSTVFDYQRDHVWDLKAHTMFNRAGRPQTWTILNDQEAVELCLREGRGLGYLILEGTALWDEDGLFKSWHDTIKGGLSDYQRQRIARGARSRPLKTEFHPKRLVALFFPEYDDLERGAEEGWLAGFQRGFRNSDVAGTARRPKFKIALAEVPREFCVLNRDLA